jgi:hypothetical protein
MQDTRVTIKGLRHYRCEGVDVPLPSVTSILSATQSAETQRKLAHWNALNPGVADAAASRGTFVHEAVENHLRGITVNPREDLKPYWKDLPEKVDELLEGGRVLWSEKPFNKPEWYKYVGEDGVGRIHYYDKDKKLGWSGCCDIIYEDNNGQIILGDFKTSVGPYSGKFPSSKSDIPEDLRKALISGVFKLKKTKLQLAAYTIAAEECLGIKITKTQIIVSTPLPDYSVQVFSFGENEIEKDKDNWWQLVRKYYEMHELTQ